MTILIDWQKQTFACSFFGDITATHIFSAMNGFYRDNRCASAKGIIIDLSGVDTMASHEELLADVAKIDLRHSLYLEDIRFAFIKGNLQAQHFIDNYLLYADDIPWTYGCFEDLDKAKSWIEVN